MSSGKWWPSSLGLNVLIFEKENNDQNLNLQHIDSVLIRRSPESNQYIY